MAVGDGLVVGVVVGAMVGTRVGVSVAKVGGACVAAKVLEAVVTAAAVEVGASTTMPPGADWVPEVAIRIGVAVGTAVFIWEFTVARRGAMFSARGSRSSNKSWRISRLTSGMESMCGSAR